jgi:SNF2 family DNA or RNA helicase
MAKAAKVAAFVDDLIDSGSGKVCVFYHHTAVAHILDEHLGHRMPVLYAGGMTDGDKDRALSEFTSETGDCEVFLGQNQAAGQGINGLQKASHTMVFAESEWSPEEMKQIMARLRRIGMDMSRPVNCYVPFVPGTIEGAMIATYIRKEQIIDRLMGMAAGGDGYTDEMKELLGDLL